MNHTPLGRRKKSAKHNGSTPLDGLPKAETILPSPELDAEGPQPGPAPRPPANAVLQSFLNQTGIVLVQGLSIERTEGGAAITRPTVNAVYRDQMQQK